MKIAYFAHAANLTGSSRSLIDLTAALKDKGVEPIVFLPANGPIEEELRLRQIKYFVLPYKMWFIKTQSVKNFPKKVKYVLKNWYNLLLTRKASKILREENIELVHSNNMYFGFGAQVAAKAGLPHVWHMRDFMEEDHQSTFFCENQAKRLFQKADALVAISDVIAAKFSKRWERSVVTIYNGVDIKKYSIPEKKIFLNPRTELLLTGRVVVTKGQMDAVKAIDLLKRKGYNIHLRIIGDGTNAGELERVQKYIQEHNLGDVVEHIPFQTDLSNYTRSSDIQLVCSYHEAFGRVTIEGMLAHSLVIGADAGCTPYLIKDGETGLLYTCKDPQSLAEKIEWAINHKKQAQKIADAGYVSGKNYSIDTTAEKVLHLYEDILEAPEC